MQKKILIPIFIFCSIAIIAQEKKPQPKTDKKWQARVRIIAAIPPVKSYTLDASTDVKITTSFVPEIDFTYFFTKNFSAELILGTTRHTVQTRADGFSPTDLGKVWLLPPTLNFQYHFNGKVISPYIGTGVNYTIFYGAKAGALDLSYKNNFGYSLQFGFDYKINKKWFLNFDFKKVFLKTDVTVKGTSTILNNVKIDPTIIGVGIGTRL